jgi:hypothetical protein
LSRKINVGGEFRFDSIQGKVNQGDNIQFVVNGKVMFNGFAVSVDRKGTGIISVVCEDALYNVYSVVYSSSNPYIISTVQNWLNTLTLMAGTGISASYPAISDEIAIVSSGNPTQSFIVYLNGYGYNLYTSTAGAIGYLYNQSAGVLSSYPTRTINEGSGYIALSKNFDNTRQYNVVYGSMNYLTYDSKNNPNGVGVLDGVFVGARNGYGKKVMLNMFAGDNLTDTQTYLTNILNGLYKEFSGGFWAVKVLSSSLSTIYDIADNSGSYPYLYTINFKDGSMLSNLILDEVEIRQDGVYYTFKSYDDTIIDLLLTISSK